MSAYVVGTDHIDYITHAARLFGFTETPYFTYPDLDSFGSALVAENVRSVLYRYDEAIDHNEAQGYAAEMDYRHRPVPARDLSIVGAIKACHCWRYQSCEHDDHASSDAWQHIDRLINHLINTLDGYDTAPWEYHRGP